MLQKILYKSNPTWISYTSIITDLDIILTNNVNFRDYYYLLAFIKHHSFE